MILYSLNILDKNEQFSVHCKYRKSNLFEAIDYFAQAVLMSSIYIITESFVHSVAYFFSESKCLNDSQFCMMLLAVDVGLVGRDGV